MTWHPSDLEFNFDPTLVVGYDGKPASDDVVLVAAHLARRVNARLHVVHAICLDDYPIDPDATDWDQQAAATVAQQRRRAESLLAAISVRWTYVALPGSPAAVLTRVADEQNALLIVLGGPGTGLSHALRLGGASVPRHIIGHQPRPVLVVPVRHCAHAA